MRLASADDNVLDEGFWMSCIRAVRSFQYRSEKSVHVLRCLFRDQLSALIFCAPSNAASREQQGQDLPLPATSPSLLWLHAHSTVYRGPQS